MLVFYGLGNNESEYLQTKHNIGRLLLEDLVQKMGLTFEKKDGYQIAKTKIGEEMVYFLTSLGYMNHSGQALQSFCNFYKLDFEKAIDRLIVFHDDSDQFELQKKFSVGGGSAGHNGINSIYKNILGLKLELDKVWRLKIGIRPILNREKSATFVLKRISKEDQLNLDRISESCRQLWPDFLALNLNKIQSTLNSLTST